MGKVSLQCKTCGNTFLRAGSDYRYQVKKGVTNFFCTRKCMSGKPLDEYSPFKRFFNWSKRHARTMKKEFSITLEYIKEVWDNQNGICPYTKMPMHLGTSTLQYKFTPTTASLDRIDSSKGYVVGNVEFVCTFVNYGKNRFCKEEVLDFFKQLSMGDGAA